MPSFKAKAIVLKTHNLGEADRILRLYSQESGLIDAVAKGARKIKSKFGGRLELFNFIDCELSKGKSLDILTQAELIRNFKNISSDFNKFLFCQLISEIILMTHPFDSGVSGNTAALLFKLLYVCFNEIDSAVSGGLYLLEKTAAFFIAKYLKITGYTPLIDSCCKCGAKISAENSHAFSIKLGGMLCQRCSAGLENYPEVKKLISKEEFEFISLLFSIDLKNYRDLNIQAQYLDNVLRIMGDYMRYHAECNIDMTLCLNKVLP